MTIGFALCGSFCTFSQVFPQLEALAQEYNVIPIFSFTAGSLDTRFGKAEDFLARAQVCTGNVPITTLEKAEPIGPKKLLDLLIIAPCTGNTLGKLAHGISDTPVTMAAKSHLRNGRPLLLAISTNDALSGSAVSLGTLLSRKHIYFVPFRQDSPFGKPASLVADFTQLLPAGKAALEHRQLEPLLLAPNV